MEEALSGGWVCSMGLGLVLGEVAAGVGVEVSRGRELGLENRLTKLPWIFRWPS